MKNFKKVLAVAVLSLTTIACFNFFSPSCVGENCNASASKTDNALPSPTPTPSATPLATDTACLAGCDIESIVIDGNVVTVPLGATETFHMSPFTKVFICDASGKPTNRFDIVPTESKCDVPRASRVQWSASSSAVVVAASGFRAEVHRVGTGAVVLTVTLDGKSASRILN